MKESLSKAEIEYWYTMVEGQQIEVWDSRGMASIRGTVETPAPEIGIMWIRTDAGERKLLDIQDDRLRMASGKNRSESSLVTEQGPLMSAEVYAAKNGGEL